jgi:predicted acylesterase/phospholipase RssA
MRKHAARGAGVAYRTTMTVQPLVAPRRLRRILSLDGGGTWSLIQIRALEVIFPGLSGLDILRQFDLVVANSGGAIIAASLAVDQTPEQMREFLLNPEKRMAGFKPTCLGHFLGLIRDLPIPRYRTDAKRENLRRELGEKSETELRQWRTGDLPDLLFTAFDYDTERGAYFRTNRQSPAASFQPSAPPDATLLDAVHASTNAPVQYFNAPAEVRSKDKELGLRRYWDGAVAALNNPIMVGVVEALASGSSPHEIRALSISSGTVSRPRVPEGGNVGDKRFSGHGSPSIKGDLAELAGAILDDPPDAATFAAHVVLGGRLPPPGAKQECEHVVRMGPVVRPELQPDGQWLWPNCGTDGLKPKDFEKLTTLDLATVEDDDLKLIAALANSWVKGEVPNQPIRHGEDMSAEIGNDRFEGAMKALRRWLPAPAQAPPSVPSGPLQRTGSEPRP